MSIRHNLRKCPGHKHRILEDRSGMCHICNGYVQEIRELEDVKGYSWIPEIGFCIILYEDDPDPNDGTEWYRFNDRGKPVKCGKI